MPQTAGTQEMFTAIKAQVMEKHNHTSEIWLFSKGFCAGDPGIIFLQKRNASNGQQWTNVMIQDECFGPALEIRDHTLNQNSDPVRLVLLAGGPYLVFNQREGFVECNWNPQKFTAVGLDPVEVALRMVAAVLAPQTARAAE
jgi:hypothetical protein